MATAPTMKRKDYPPPGRPEPLWPAQVAILAAIGLQLALPDRLTVGPFWLVPALEGAMLIGFALAFTSRIEEEHPKRRRLALGLTAFVSAANIYSLAALTHLLLHKHESNGRELIYSGAAIWLTNVVIFGLWYWETDRGGPGRRAMGRDEPPDLLFPQMLDDSIEPRHWRPEFLDYMYVAFTNATAFSPTDTMPLTQLAKVIMTLQALVSLVTIGLVVSRAVNILA